MTDFYSEIEKIRNNIEKEIIDVMDRNELTEFRFKTPIVVTKNEETGDGEVYKIALDTNDDNGNKKLLIYSSWNNAYHNANYDDGEYYFTTDFFIEDLCEIHFSLTDRINNQQIKILSDYGNVYQANTILSVQELINDYGNTVKEEDFAIVDKWDRRKAVEFIANAWGLKIEFLS